LHYLINNLNTIKALWYHIHISMKRRRPVKIEYEAESSAATENVEVSGWYATMAGLPDFYCMFDLLFHYI